MMASTDPTPFTSTNVQMVPRAAKPSNVDSAGGGRHRLRPLHGGSEESQSELITAEASTPAAIHATLNHVQV